ncbi:hypothetical protein Tco_0249222, partial [Tanacetum coccineum]
DVNDPIPEDGFQASDVHLLTERVVDLRPVPSGLLFYGGLATTWDLPVFALFSKIPRGMVIFYHLALLCEVVLACTNIIFSFVVVTMSEYLRFPFLSGTSISKGPLLTSQDQIEQHTARPLSTDQPIPEKTDHQNEIEVEDPKIVAIRERKARAAAQKKERDREKMARR